MGHSGIRPDKYVNKSCKTAVAVAEVVFAHDIDSSRLFLPSL